MAANSDTVRLPFNLSGYPIWNSLLHLPNLIAQNMPSSAFYAKVRNEVVHALTMEPD